MYPLLFKHGLLENNPIVFFPFIFIPSYYYWSVNTIFHGTTVKQPRLVRQGHWSQHGVSIHHSTALEFDSVAWRLVCSNMLDFTSGAKEDTARSATWPLCIEQESGLKALVLFGYILSIVSSMFFVMWYNGIPNNKHLPFGDHIYHQFMMVLGMKMDKDQHLPRYDDPQVILWLMQYDRVPLGENLRETVQWIVAWVPPNNYLKTTDDGLFKSPNWIILNHLAENNHCSQSSMAMDRVAPPFGDKPIW